MKPFVDASLVVAGKLGNRLQYVMGRVVEAELKTVMKEPMPVNLEPAPTTRSTQGIVQLYEKLQVGGRRTCDWEGWLEVPEDSILVTMDHKYTRKAPSYAQRGLHWGAKGKVFSFHSIQQFEDSIALAEGSQSRWIALCRQAGGDLP